MKPFARLSAWTALGALLLAAPAAVHAHPSYLAMPYIGEWDSPLPSAAQIPWDDITHIAEAFALPQYSGATPTFAAPGQIPWLVGSAHANGVKCVLSIGGASADNSAWSSSTQPAALGAFVANIMGLVAASGYDGVDIDWEFPGSWGDPSDYADFTALMSALYKALHDPADPNYKGAAFDGSPKSLSFYITPGYFICGVDWDAVGASCDFATIPGYDICPDGITEGPINGGWTFQDCRGTVDVPETVAGNMVKLTAGGADQFTFPRSKLVLGLPFYTCGGSQIKALTASGSHSSLNATTLESLWSSGATVNDSQAICAKTNWALSQGFKGIEMWEISQALPNSTVELGNIWSTVGGKSGCVAQPSATPSPGGVTALPTGTPSASPSRTATPSATPSATRTVGPTGTRTATASATPSGTLSATPCATASPSGTPTTTPTGTRTDTLSVTPSITMMPTGTVSSTRSPSASPSAGASATRTVTLSPTVTATATVSPMDSLSATPTFTAARSASPAPSGSATAKPSATLTCTVTGTASAMATLTFNGTMTPSRTATPTATVSVTFTPGGSASATARATGTRTVTATPTASPVPTASVTATPAIIAGPGASASPSPGLTAAAGSGPLQIDRGAARPDPDPYTVAFHLLGDADDVRLQCFTAALVRVGEAHSGPRRAGWGSLGLPPALRQSLRGGACYLVLTPSRGAQAGRRIVVKAYLTH